MNDAGPAELLRALRGLVDRQTLRIELDFSRLDHMDSPVGVEADSNILVYAGIPICALVFWQLGLWPGAASVAFFVALYFTLGRRYVRRRLARRVHDQALQDSELWRKLWRFGGVTLVRGEGDAPSRCTAPDGNWMALVRDLTASPDARRPERNGASADGG
ncbi:MAG: hypothetical protein JO255_10605 [Alphaproteobacteria bacterium]|nr:hypothetical protein [Alphaproteobacteria bacterium]